MQSLILLCSLFQAIYLGAGDDTPKYGQDGKIISVLLKKIWDLEERDRAFDRKLEEINVLKERLDEAQRRLANMQELEFRLQNAEERIRMLVNRVENNNADCKVNKSATMKGSDTNLSHANADIDYSGSVSRRHAVSNIKSHHDELIDKFTKLGNFTNRIQTVQTISAKKDLKRTVTRHAAFTATFSSTPVTLTPGRSLLFDRVDFNEGNAYDPSTGIFTCPVSGAYFFVTNILTEFNGGVVETEIVAQGHGKGKTHAYTMNQHGQGSTAAALHCEAGQRVWVQAVVGSQAYGMTFSSFTGILLWSSDIATNSN